MNVWVCGERLCTGNRLWLVAQVSPTEAEAKRFLEGMRGKLAEECGCTVDDFYMTDDGDQSWRLEGCGRVWSAEVFPLNVTWF